MTILQKLTRWWRRLPTRQRIKIIAGLILICAGPEAAIWAVPALDLAFVIDAFGIGFALTLLFWNGPFGLPFLSVWVPAKARAIVHWYETQRDTINHVLFRVSRILGSFRLVAFCSCAVLMLLVFGQQALHALIYVRR